MGKDKLFLLHFAGGSCFSYNFLSPYLEDFEVIPLELPGRGKRMQEMLITSFEAAAIDLTQQIIRRTSHGSKFILYGHSMGASLGLMICQMLSDSGRKPQHLFVSGNAGPGVGERKSYHLLNRVDFTKELIALGGIPEELAESDELLDFFLPIVRADFEIIYKLDTERDYSFDIPIYAMMGTEEDNARYITNWKRFTNAGFDYKLFKGGHFFIYSFPVEIADIIKSEYESNSVCKHRHTRRK